jgi:hypothetical protein
VTSPVSLFDDIVLLLTLRSISCEFDAGQKCEVKWEIDGAHGLEGELRVCGSPAAVELLQPGDVYGIHMRKL